MKEYAIIEFEVPDEDDCKRCDQCGEPGELHLVTSGSVYKAWCQRHALDALVRPDEREDLTDVMRLEMIKDGGGWICWPCGYTWSSELNEEVCPRCGEGELIEEIVARPPGE